MSPSNFSLKEEKTTDNMDHNYNKSKLDESVTTLVSDKTKNKMSIYNT